MTPLIVALAVAAYFVVLFAISRVAGRHADNNAFFTGSRRAPWPAVAFATVGAAISGVTFISVPGMVADKGFSYLQMVLGFVAGYFVIAFVLVPLFYRRNLLSIYGYLDERFGRRTYRTGAWFFFVSKMLGAAVRFFVVCIVLQTLLFGPLGVPFAANVAVTVGLVWLYTFQGGVKSLIWTDAFKSLCMVLAVALCAWFIAGNLGMGFGDIASRVKSHESFRMFYFDNPREAIYFWKQFVAGVFMAIAINGLDHDMMQRHLACRDSRSSQKNMIVSGVMQFFVIGLFLVLGVLMLIYVDLTPGLERPAKSDELFGLVAAHDSLPVVVGVLFVIGLVAAAYSAAGSAMVSLTTSFSVDILDGASMEPERLRRVRRLVHAGMAVVMGAVIVTFYMLSDDDAISAVYTLASYTYGPLLGLFAFGLLCNRPVNDRLVPVVCLAAPALSWVIQHTLATRAGYHVGFELLLINALLTLGGLLLLSRRSCPAAAGSQIVNSKS